MSALSSVLNNPCMTHFLQMMELIQYLVNTKTLTIKYSPRSHPELRARCPHVWALVRVVRAIRHRDELRCLPWSLEMQLADSSRLLFVHAGLEEKGGAGTWEEQLDTLKRKDCTVARHETIWGRQNVLKTPSGLQGQGTTLISGHHGIVGLGR